MRKHVQPSVARTAEQQYKGKGTQSRRSPVWPQQWLSIPEDLTMHRRPRVAFEGSSKPYQQDSRTWRRKLGRHREWFTRLEDHPTHICPQNTPQQHWTMEGNSRHAAP